MIDPGEVHITIVLSIGWGTITGLVILGVVLSVCIPWMRRQSDVSPKRPDVNPTTGPNPNKR